MKNAFAALAATFLLACSTNAESQFAAQRAAHSALAYALGNDTSAPADPALRADLLELRQAILDGEATQLPTIAGEVNGMRALFVRVYGSSANHADVAELIDEIGDRLSLETPGAGDFFAIDLGQECEADGVCYTLRGMDPSPAQLTANLTATTGATAAATYPDATPTTAFQWPSTYTSTTRFLGGEPCSIVQLAPGEWTSRVIVKTGNYAKCM